MYSIVFNGEDSLSYSASSRSYWTVRTWGKKHKFTDWTALCNCVGIFKDYAYKSSTLLWFYSLESGFLLQLCFSPNILFVSLRF